jgi:hypothetical protein
MLCYTAGSQVYKRKSYNMSEENEIKLEQGKEYYIKIHNHSMWTKFTYIWSDNRSLVIEDCGSHIPMRFTYDKIKTNFLGAFKEVDAERDIVISEAREYFNGMIVDSHSAKPRDIMNKLYDAGMLVRKKL